MCIEILSYAARFRYLEDKNLIFDLQQYKKEDLPRPTKGKLATITEPNEIGELLCKIEESEARQTYPVALALQLAPYVMLRPGELVGGRWDEINFDKSEWYINAERMKPGFDHVVPLPRQAVELIKKLHYFSGNGEFMFPSSSRGRGEHITPQPWSWLSGVWNTNPATSPRTASGQRQAPSWMATRRMK